MSEPPTEQNIARYAQWFCDETGAAGQKHARALLLAEEKRFGSYSEHLDRVDCHIGQGRERIARQRTLVGQLESHGSDARVAVALLAALVELLDLFEKYRNAILDALDRGRLSEPGRYGAHSRSHGLTRREIEVLHHVSYGRSSRDIAGLLGLTERTVSAHREAICAKFGVTTAAAAVAAAIRADVLAC